MRLSSRWGDEAVGMVQVAGQAARLAASASATWASFQARPDLSPVCTPRQVSACTEVPDGRWHLTSPIATCLPPRESGQGSVWAHEQHLQARFREFWERIILRDGKGISHASPSDVCGTRESLLGANLTSPKGAFRASPVGPALDGHSVCHYGGGGRQGLSCCP